MAHKRKDTISQKKVERAKHLRPFEKRMVVKDERRAAGKLIRKESFEASFNNVQRLFKDLEAFL